MNLVERASLYTMRQKQKSILLFLVLILVSTLVLTGISIGSAVNETFADMRRNISGTITLERSMPELDHEAILRASDEGGVEASGRAFAEQLNSGDFVTFDTLEAIMAVPSVSGHNLTAEFQMADAKSGNFEFLADNEGYYGNAYGEVVPTTFAAIQSSTNSEQMIGFLSGNLRLVDGRHLSADDYRKVMVSDDLAAYNNLYVGDTLEISGRPLGLGIEGVSSRTLEFEIIGTFTGTRALEEDEMGSNHVLDPLVLDADTLIIDMATLMEEYERTNYFGTGVAGSLPGPLSIFLEDPNELDYIYNEIANLPEVYGKTFDLTVGTEGLEDVMSSLSSLQGLVGTLLVSIALVSMAILAILLTIWTRGRVKEIGIYLANGIKKGEIMRQFTLEVVLIAIVAFALSLPISHVIAVSAGDYIIDQFASAEALRNEQLEGSTAMQELSGLVLTMQETGFMDVADIANTLEMVDVNVSGHDLMWVYVIGLPVVMGSVLIASHPIVKLKPKEILSKMS